MKSASQWFSEYGESHQNTTNEYIHWVCVPAIFFSLLGLFSFISIPFGTPFNWLNSAMPLLVIGGLGFYATMGFRVFAGMALYLVPNIYLLHYLWSAEYGINLYIVIFVVAWIGQFIGHKIEGKKPSFLKDIQFLMIGPAWVLQGWFGNKG